VQTHASTEDMEVGTGNGGTSGPRAATCRGPQHRTPEGSPSRAGEGYDQTPEAMQITALNGEDSSNVTHTTMLQESAVDDNVDGEGEAVRAKDETAEGQTSALRKQTRARQRVDREC
jgi:hypothetical protein